ncbi:hypothetical protein B2G71_21765 [Novosphingobium sp. PC22D]|uniref:RcnB family protein n=1 Tax=Novosphingobium sp. PC22D TaxID=1962403 RepID=UPI000BFAB5B6|nr:RcnB family protein [Novosphingobium sp. PC22D]PEQ10552.1 hypothetical protein B2G71_21765 [Novosphingobium sp. PC22D]
MKKLALVTAAFATVFSTAAMAAPSYGQNNGRAGHGVEQRHDSHQDNRNSSSRAEQRRDNERQVYKTSTHGWKKGDRFDSRKAANFRVISQPKAYGLKDAPRGYRWVQSDNDVVLVAITSGVVAAVLSNILA